MSRARFFLTSEQELVEGATVALRLSHDDARHAARVLRIAPGEQIDVVTPSGTAWRVEVQDVTRDSVAARPVELLAPVRHPHIALFQGVAKGDKMDAIVRQAVEVGAAEVVPVMTARTIVRLDPRKRVERGDRWRRVAESAAKQARRACVPAVSDPVDMTGALRLLGEYDFVLVLWEEHTGRLLLRQLRDVFSTPDVRVALIVGPEGGLAPDEVATLESAGALAVSLGPSVLRTETAAVVALGIAAAVAHEVDSDGSVS